MPNFVAKNVGNKPYPFGYDDVSFDWEVQGRLEKLIYTRSGDDEFFIIVKQNKNSKNFIIKGEKITKPARVGLLQKALCVYKDKNTSDVVSEAIAFKHTRLLRSPLIVDVNDFCAKFSELKDKFSKIYIEIGFGSGRHLLFQAKQNLDTLIIGIEVYKPSIEQVAKLAKSENLENIRLINTDARLLLSLIQSNFIDKIFLHFPVPWDKAEHRRVVSAGFAKECERVLKVGGKFELRTDSREYCDFSLMTFLNLENPQIELKKNENLDISSKYEDRWKKQEKNIYDMSYTCKILSDESEEIAPFNFNGYYDMVAILREFKNTTFKEQEHFLHLEEIYKSTDKIIIKVAFGAFSRPEHCYIKLENDRCEYFIKKPLLTKQNFKAHKNLQEYLAKCKI